MIWVGLGLGLIAPFTIRAAKDLFDALSAGRTVRQWWQSI